MPSYFHNYLDKSAEGPKVEWATITASPQKGDWSLGQVEAVTNAVEEEIRFLWVASNAEHDNNESW